MADFDSADLLARCRRYAARPSVDEAFGDSAWYALLTEAEARWLPMLAIHDPGSMYGAPTQLSSDDGGYTYQLTEEPLALELYTSVNGNPLFPGAYSDPEADYVLEGDEIRMVRGRARDFSDGPYARWISPPAAINASTASQIQPARHRMLLVYDALEKWASVGGHMDPTYWRHLLQATLYGDPEIPGDVGIIGSAKRRDFARGMAAYAHGGQGYRWWRPNG